MNVDVTSHPNIGQLPSISECGFSSIVKKERRRRKRIVGGDAVAFGAYPWTVRQALLVPTCEKNKQCFYSFGTL